MGALKPLAIASTILALYLICWYCYSSIQSKPRSSSSSAPNLANVDEEEAEAQMENQEIHLEEPAIGTQQTTTPSNWSLESDMRLPLLKHTTPQMLRKSLVRLGTMGPATKDICEVLQGHSASKPLSICFFGGSVTTYNNFPQRTMKLLRKLYPHFQVLFNGKDALSSQIAATPGCGPEYLSFCLEHHASNCSIALVEMAVNDFQLKNATSFERLLRRLFLRTNGAVVTYYHTGVTYRGNMKNQDRVARHYDLPAIALLPVQKLLPNFSESTKSYYTDYVHPTPLLASIIAELISSFFLHFEKLVCPLHQPGARMQSLGPTKLDCSPGSSGPPAEHSADLKLQTSIQPYLPDVPFDMETSKCWTVLGDHLPRNFVPKNKTGDWFYHLDVNTWSHGKWGYLSQRNGSEIQFQIEGCPNGMYLYYMRSWRWYGTADVYVDERHVSTIQALWGKPFTVAAQKYMRTFGKGVFTLRIVNREMNKFKVFGASCDG